MARVVVRVKGDARGSVQKWVASVARREHAKILARAPMPDGFKRIVDGVQGAPETSVKPGGRILYLYKRMDLIVQYAMEVLYDLSPVRQGDYRAGHRIFLNGREVSNLKDYQDGDEVLVTNYMPYARKIEIGKMTLHVPGSFRVYQRARGKVSRRFGNQVSVQFTYRGMVDGVAVNPATAGPIVKAPIMRRKSGRFMPGSGRRLSGGEHNNPTLRYPCLIFHPAGTNFRTPRRR